MTRTIIVDNGILSTRDDIAADTHKIKIVATANLADSETESMTASVCLPTQFIRPNFDNA